MTSPSPSSKTTKLRLFQTMAGARHGGAELFFERLAGAFHEAGVTQRLMIKPDPDRMARLAAAGLAVEGCGFSPLLTALHRRQIANAIRRERPDVILSWMNRATAMTPPADVRMSRGLAGSTISNITGMRLAGGEHARHRRLSGREGVPADRVHHQINFVPDGADGPQYDGPRHDGPVIAALGRLHPNKAFDILIRALADADEGTLLWLAGDGPEREALGSAGRRIGDCRNGFISSAGRMIRRRSSAAPTYWSARRGTSLSAM